MKFNRHILQKIRERTDIVGVVSQYTQLKQRGDRWWGLSPFKPEKTPSFAVKPEEGFYYCFATQKGGDVFRFIQEMEGLSFPDAVAYLAESAGIPLEQSESDGKEEKERKALFELYERVTKTFRYFLQDDEKGKHAREYVTARGITEDSIDTFELGYSVNESKWLYRFLLTKSYSPEFLANCGLFSQRSVEYSLFRNRLMFPIRDERGRVVAFGGRALAAEERAKYINSPETPIYTKKRTLYGLYAALDAIRQERRVLLAEGYTDVIALHQSGLEQSVAPLGTAFTDEQARLIKRWADEVVLVFDADSAGVEATFRAATVAEKAALNCMAVAVPKGKDPADLFRNEGADAVRQMIDGVVPVFDYLLDKSAENLDRSSPRSGELLLRKLFPYISIISSEVRREALFERIGDLLHVTVPAVVADFESWRKGEHPHRIAEPVQQNKSKTSRDVSLLLATAHDGELFAYLRQIVSVDDIEDATARQLYYSLEDAYRHGEPLARGVIDRISDETTRDFVLQRLTSEEFSGWTKRDIDHAIGYLQIRKLQERQRELERLLKTLNEQDQHEIRRVLEQKMAIDQELAKLKVRADDRVAE
ncbi:MAG: DNA primase [Alkalispirochaeta sp.]